MEINDIVYPQTFRNRNGRRFLFRPRGYVIIVMSGAMLTEAACVEDSHGSRRCDFRTIYKFNHICFVFFSVSLYLSFFLSPSVCLVLSFEF